jgi:hypothetical protein
MSPAAVAAVRAAAPLPPPTHVRGLACPRRERVRPAAVLTPHAAAQVADQSAYPSAPTRRPPRERGTGRRPAPRAALPPRPAARAGRSSRAEGRLAWESPEVRASRLEQRRRSSADRARSSGAARTSDSRPATARREGELPRGRRPQIEGKGPSPPRAVPADPAQEGDDARHDAHAHDRKLEAGHGLSLVEFDLNARPPPRGFASAPPSS